MKDISLFEALQDCTATCGWCIHHCPDVDKYDILVLCIRLQKEFINIWKNINSILPGRTNSIENLMLGVFTKLSEIEHRTAEKQKRFLTPYSNKSENILRMPGCSQIFLLAQSLEETLWNES